MKKITFPFIYISNFINTKTELLLIVVSLFISCLSFIYYFSHGLTTVYGDSLGHLNIARRVIDSPTPGLAQLGGYWLPLLHLLMLPTIWNNFFWQTGLSGSLVNMIAYIITILFIYKLVLLITKNKYTPVLAALLVMCNPSFIFMQTTPMTEVLFVMCITVAVYFFYKGTVTDKLEHYIIAAFFLFLASMDRYEAWATVVLSCIFILYQWVRTKFSRKWESYFILFSILAGFGMGLWILWGMIIFHDPFEFLHNELSAGNQTKVQYTTISPTGEHNIPLAFLTNLLAIVHTSGLIITILGCVGIALYLFKNRKNLLSIKTLSLLLLLTPFLFEVLTVFSGKVPVEVPELSKMPAPSNLFNIRYALYSLPALAIFTSLISKKKTVIAVLIIPILLNYFSLVASPRHPLSILTDAGASNIPNSEFTRNVNWFKKHYDGAPVLASTGGSDGFMFETGLPLKDYITEGSYKTWDAAMIDPAPYAEWIVTSSNNKLDLLYKHIDKNKLAQEYTTAYEKNGFMILKRKPQFFNTN